MAVGCGPLIDRAAQLQMLPDPARAQIHDLPQRLLKLLLRDAARAVQIHIERERLRDADRVGQLQRAFVGEPGRDHVLGEIARGISRGAIDLGRVLAGEGAAAMGCRAAIRVDDDLPPRESGIAVGAADHEAAGGIDVEFGRAVDPAFRHHLVDEAVHDLLHPLLAHIFAVLGRDHDGVGAHGPAVLVDERHLALGVGAELGRAAAMPGLGHLMQDAVRVEDRRGHERLGLAAGEAEHDALIAGALVLLLLGIGIDAGGDVGRLLMHIKLELGQVPMEPLLLVSDLAHGAPRGLLDLVPRHAFGSAHFARHDDAVGRDERLDRDPR